MKLAKYKTIQGDGRIPQLVKESSYDSSLDTLNNPEKVVKLMKDVFQIHRETEEYLYEICVDTKGKPIAIFEISPGSVFGTMAASREIFQKALLVGGNGIVVVHNHPSGDCEPSKEDRKVASKLKEAGRLMDINLVDSIIIGDEYYSFTESENL